MVFTVVSLLRARSLSHICSGANAVVRAEPILECVSTNARFCISKTSRSGAEVINFGSYKGFVTRKVFSQE